jgi:hypothetical protein
MIGQIIELLNASDWYGVSEDIDIAKGKYKAVSNMKEAKEQIKRAYYGRK